MGVGFERLRSSRAVREVFAARCTSASEVAVLHARRRGDDGPARATVVAGKAVGNAVARNRVKRRLREAARGLPLSPGTDVVIVGRPAAAEAPFTELRAALTRQIATVGRSR